jgi:plastocyanin
MAKTIIIGLVALLVVGGGGYLVLHKKTNNSSASSSTQTTASSGSGSSQKAAATITYSNSGFSPSTTTVKAGDVVAINNTSSGDMQLDSNPHPIHTDDTDLNVGLVGAGQTKTFTVTQKGTFGFHNHLNPGDTATIIVQ